MGKASSLYRFLFLFMMFKGNLIKPKHEITVPIIPSQELQHYRDVASPSSARDPGLLLLHQGDHGEGGGGDPDISGERGGRSDPGEHARHPLLPGPGPGAPHHRHHGSPGQQGEELGQGQLRPCGGPGQSQFMANWQSHIISISIDH